MWTQQHERVLRKLAADHYFRDVMDADIGPPKRFGPQLYPNLRKLRLEPYHVVDRYCRRIMLRMQERYQ